MRNRSVFRASLVLFSSLLLAGCGTATVDNPSSAPPNASNQVAPTPTSSAAQTASITGTSTPTTPATTSAPPKPVVSNDRKFTTPDGSLSFTYPASWTVTPIADQPNNYLLADASGVERATLRDKVEKLPFLSVVTGLDAGYKQNVRGIKGSGGQGVSLLVQGTFGQAAGSQGASYALATDGSKDPIGRAAIEVQGGGYYVIFTGYKALTTPSVPPSNEELVTASKAFAASASFVETAKVMTSLTLHSEKVRAVGCLGARYRYLKLTGIDCDQAKATLDRVEKTGTGAGARNMETADYLCFYASAVESQSGQADVICQSKDTSKSVSFEAWLK